MNDIRNLYMLFSLLICIASSCSDGREPVEDMSTMTINSCYVLENNSLSVSFASPIGLYLLTEDNEPYDSDSYKNSANLVHSKWEITTPVYIVGKGLVYAYYPYRPGDGLPIMDIDMKDQTDILYAKVPSVIETGNSSLALKLFHALSQVAVAVEGEEVASITLYSPSTATFDICTGSFDELKYNEVSCSSGQLLIIPHHLSKGEMKIRLKSGTEYAYEISNMEFSSGENYTYSFKLNSNREKLEITSVTVEDWINDFTHQDYLR